jgi:acetylornithine deacetylase
VLIVPWQGRVRSALRRLQPQLRQLAEQLIAVPSVGGTAAEAEVQGVVADWLSARGVPTVLTTSAVAVAEPGFPGMEVTRSSVTDAVGRLAGTGTGRDLLLLGHTDVVPAADRSAFAPQWRDGDLVGRGAADMKAGVAAMCAAAAAWAACGHRLAGDLVIATVSAEEDGGAGTYHLLRDPARVPLRPGSAAIIPEPTAGRVVTANAGCLTFRIRLPGRAAHGALRWQGRNPLDRLPTILAALRALEAQRCRGADARFAEFPLAYPISVGTIAGGDWASTVPDEVVLTGRYGVRLGESLPAARAAFEAAITRACAADPALATDPPRIEWWGAEFASAETASAEPIVAALHGAGAADGVTAAPYGSDLRLVVGMAGIPAVQFGPGRPEDAHAADERVAWPQVQRCAEVLALTAGVFCGAGDAVDNQ